MQTEDLEPVEHQVHALVVNAPCHHHLTAFDPTDARHRQRLLEWAQHQWPDLFEKAFLHRNSLFWHYCCSSVSKRRFMESAGHPTLHTQSIFPMPSFKAVKTADQLYEWLLEMLEQTKQRGFKALLPAINRCHIDLGTVDTLALNQRVADLSQELEEKKSMISKLEGQLERLEKQNKQLISTARTWCQLYHGLLESQDHQSRHHQSALQEKNSIICLDVFETQF